MELFDRIINFKKSELLIFFILAMVICLVFNILPFIKYNDESSKDVEYAILSHTK